MRSRLREVIVFASGFSAAVVLLLLGTFIEPYDRFNNAFPLDLSNVSTTNVSAVLRTLSSEHAAVSRETSLLRRNVRIFCWIMTSPTTTWTRAIHVNATWAPLCDKHVFVTAAKGSGLPSWQTGLTETRDHLWGKTKRAFRHIHDHELSGYDWFLKADDDTYVVVDNLRFMLLAHSPDAPLYFGCRFRPYVRQGYMSGGSGYVLSRQAVRQLVERGLSADAPADCQLSDAGIEDVLIGRCLETVGVRPGDSRDGQNRHRMLPFAPSIHLDPIARLPTWFSLYIYYPYQQGSDCCGEYVISFHYVTRSDFYFIHHLLYRTSVFGRRSETTYQLLLQSTSRRPSDAWILRRMRRLSAADAPSAAHHALASETSAN